MAAASDKARFFLEQSVPELKEYERKKIFSPEEITSIAKKRSDLEHKINARGSAASDYARYAEFEINVESLRKKRVKRLGVKATSHNGQRRIFFVFDRGTKKHPGDVGLWLQAIEFARRQKAYKKLTQILTNVIRLHPTRPELWVYAAQFAMEENGDITEARGYMQRGLRFCKSKKEMWLQYLRLEMSYIAKIHARRQILGLCTDDTVQGRGDALNDEAAATDLSRSIVAGNLEAGEDATDEEVVRKMEKSPALGAAVPLAIFDAAMAHFNDEPAIAHAFVQVLAEYHELAASRKVLGHIRAHLFSTQQTSWVAQACDIREPVFGITVTSSDFPAALRESLKRLRRAQLEGAERTALMQWSTTWLESLLAADDADPAIETVIKAMVRSINEDASAGGG